MSHRPFLLTASNLFGGATLICLMNSLVKMKTDSGMRHGRWKHKGQRESEGGNEGRGMRENRPAEVCVCVCVWGGGFSRKHTLLYYRCSIGCYSSYMVADATFVWSSQINNRRQHNLGGTLQKTSNLLSQFQGWFWLSSLLFHLSASSKITQPGMNCSNAIICTWLI